MTNPPFSQDLDGCYAARIGARGLDPATFAATLERTRAALEALRRHHDRSTLPLLHMAGKRDDLAIVTDTAARLAAFPHVVFLGTGGSSLGGRTLAALADGGWASAAEPVKRPRLWFLENVDPDGFARVVDHLPLDRTALAIVSKSGGTAETLAGALALLPRIEKEVGRAELARRAVVVTEPADNPLRRLAQRWGLPVVDHPDVGGRYSVLSATGMLPALCAGVDGEAVRDGAGVALADALTLDPARSPAAQGAALQIALAETRGITQSVMLTYIDRLACFGLWYCQLWAESLGKQGKGTTPIRALGTVDQHSQLQLYLAGPADKLVTVVMGAPAGQGPRYPRDLGDPALAWLGGRTMGDLLDVSQRATAETLMRNGRPTRILRVPRLDERALGALLMHFMLETIIAGHLLGVDPFDQPAVEEGKRLARDYLAEIAAR